MDINGTAAIVTGAASGLGAATAKALADAGAKVTIFDLNEESGVAHAEAIGGHFARVDVSDEQSVIDGIASAREAHGPARILVSCAGIGPASKTVGRRGPHKLSLFKKVIDVNLTGVMLTCRAVGRHMVERGEGGVLVNLASSAARIALPGAAEYCVSKAGVVMLTQVMAMELLSHGIRVNAIGPGFIETPMTAAMREDPEGRARMEGMTPMGRLGQPIEIANAALYLLSEESSYTTGHTLYPNGGIFVG